MKNTAALQDRGVGGRRNALMPNLHAYILITDPGKKRFLQGCGQGFS